MIICNPFRSLSSFLMLDGQQMFILPFSLHYYSKSKNNMFEIEKGPLDGPDLVRVCLSTQTLHRMGECAIENSEPAIEVPSFSLWWEERQSPLHLLISSPTAFDEAESQKGISDVQRVCRETASVNIYEYAIVILRLLLIHQRNGLNDLVCCLFLIIGTDRVDISDLSHVYGSRPAWWRKDCKAM